MTASSATRRPDGHGLPDHHRHLVAYGRPDGQIIIRGLAARCVIGAHPRERRIRQRVELDLVLDVTTATASAATDHLDDAVDYRTLKDRILRHVEGSRYHLLESLGHAVVRMCLATPGVVHADVTVDKPGALTGAKSVAVRIVRTRSGPLRKKRARTRSDRGPAARAALPNRGTRRPRRATAAPSSPARGARLRKAWPADAEA